MGDVLAGAGLFAATVAAAAAIVWRPSGRRSAAMLVALALIPVLILADQWNSPEVTDLRDDAGRFAALGIAALAAVALLALAFRRHPLLLPLAVIAAIPFRVPIEAGGEDVNLLVPLYLVIGGGVLATCWAWWGRGWGKERELASGGGAAGRGPAPRGLWSTGGTAPAATGPPAGRTVALRWVLAAVLVLYAVQSVYSDDFSRALQNSVFFYVPFALAFVLLADRRWDRWLLLAAIGVVVAEGLVFVLFGFWEYATRELIWNPEVMRSNEFHNYFRVNSLFWDPNIYGRYLALVLTALVAALLWARGLRPTLWIGALALLLWLGLVTTFSQSSFAALLAGMAALAALRWSLRWTAVASVAAVLAAAAFVIAAGGSLKIDFSTERKLNQDTGGRANLVSDGIALFGDRPLWGYGSGSFPVAYRQQRTGGGGQLSVSHTEPVTVAAEQGLIGLAGYLALLGVAFATLARGMTAVMPGLRSPPSAGGAAGPAPARADQGARAGGGPAATGPAAGGLVHRASRAAVFACFVGLIAHTMGYAGFLEDPLTWVLLAIGGALAAAGSHDDDRTAAAGERDPAASASPARAPA